MGNELATSILLKCQANPNCAGVSNKTPLHVAKNPEIVQLLVEGKADPTLMMNTTSDDKYAVNNISAFERLVTRNADCAKEVLDSQIVSNGKSVDSKDLLLIFDFKPFHRPDEIATNEGKEMLYHKAMIQYECSHLLAHPLSEAFMAMKWQKVQKMYFVNLLICFVHALAIVAVTLKTDNLCTDCQFRDPENKSDCESTGFAMGYDIAYGFLFFTTTFTSLLNVCLRVLLNGRTVFRKGRAYLELFTTLFCFVYVGIYFIMDRTCSALGIICGFLAWLQFTIVLGRFPTFGIYINMAMCVMKPIIKLLFIASANLITFALAFHMLLPNNDVFQNYLSGFVNILTMMMGEYGYITTFAPEDKGNSHAPIINYVLTQCMYLAFFLLAIVLSNIILGLTVSKTDEMYKMANEVKLEDCCKELIGLDKVFNRKTCFGSLASALDRHTGIFPRIKGKDGDHVICVSPNRQKNTSWMRKKKEEKVIKVLTAGVYTQLTHIKTTDCYNPTTS